MPFDESKLLNDEPKLLALIAAQQLPAMVGQVQPDYQRLADAIYRSEGAKKTAHPYGIKSVKVKDEAEARQVAINTMRNNYKRWLDADKKWEGKPVTYLEFTANRFVPPSADPVGNKNWKVNVPLIYAASEPAPRMTLRDTINVPKLASGYDVTNLPSYKNAIR